VARGAERSRSIDEIVSEINALYEEGILEVVLVGVHLGGYGSDLGLNLRELIMAILQYTVMPRIRLGSLEPWELGEDFVELFDHARLMPHLHLPLQSGADSVLRRMARRTRTADFAKLVGQLRSRIADVRLSTDIIIGFPGETEVEWNQSLAFIESMAFEQIHCFDFSPRQGTSAAAMANPVDEATLQIRSRQLRERTRQWTVAGMEKYLNREFKVLWEGVRETLADGRRRHFGFTPNYLKVETLAHENQEITGRILKARLQAVSDEGEQVLGELKPRSS
jgi:threonylcarbamoyladenosine tRNA methylthiotransferase MtaB